MRKKVLMVLLILVLQGSITVLGAKPLKNRKGVVCFKVSDGGSQAPIEDVFIEVDSLSGYTDSDGFARLRLKYGTYTWIMSKPGYLPEEGTIIVEARTTWIYVDMTAETIEPPPEPQIVPSLPLPRIQISGSKITPLIKGVNLTPFIYDINGVSGGHVFGEADIAGMKSWGFNAVRLGFSQEYWDGSPEYKQRIIDMVNLIESYGMYTVLNNHWSDSVNQLNEGHPHNWETWKAMWVEIATIFNGRTNIVYELYNEPHEPQLLEWVWQAQVEECIDMMRAVDPDAIPLIQGFWWGSYFEWCIDYPIRRDNIIYTGHHYIYWDPWYGFEESGVYEFMEERYWDYVIDVMNRPILDTECGAFSEAEAYWLRNFLNVMTREKIGWMVFDWHIYPDQPCILEEDWETPNYAGEVVLDFLGTDTPEMDPPPPPPQDPKPTPDPPSPNQ